MFEHYHRRLLAVIVFASLLAYSPTTAGAQEPEITFVGGGYGHGIGMSQYGAYGRADAGHTYEQILAFYYDGTGLSDVADFSDDTTNFSTDDDVDVRVAIRETMAISTPLDQIGDWTIDLFAGGLQIGTATRPISVDWNGSVWTAVSNGVDLCHGVAECTNNPLEFEMSLEERVVLEEVVNGANFGEYRSGRIILHPASIPGPKGDLTHQCGKVIMQQFCVIHGDLDLQSYLYGLQEVPASWPDEALKAQAVAGRSYAVSRILARNANVGWTAPFDLYNSVQDQYYTGWPMWSNCDGLSWCAAVDATDNKVVSYGGTVAETFYSASNGGATAAPPDVWSGGTTRPYLLAKADHFDSNDANPYKIQKYTYTIAEISRWLNDYNLPGLIDQDQLKVGTVASISIEPSISGRVSYARVTIEGSLKTTTLEGRVRRGELVPGPYGFRLYAALNQGCRATPGCVALRSTNFRVGSAADTHSEAQTTAEALPAEALPAEETVAESQPAEETVAENQPAEETAAENQPVINIFEDTQPEDYFYEPVLWMATEEITTGIAGSNRFAPRRQITRAEVATFVWRYAGKPDTSATNNFSDVHAEQFYTTAVAWMAANNITTGKKPTEFAPNDKVTRGELATFLWRYAGKPEAPATSVFTDVPSGKYYTEAVEWMVRWAITEGTSDTTFSPQNPLTRGEMATFVWRLARTPDAFAAR